MIIRIKATNYKIHKHLDISPNGKSFFVVGDSEQGKSTLLEIILASLLLKPFPADPVSDGEEKGSIEVTHSFEGKEFTISRDFTKTGGLKRFTMTSKDGFETSPTKGLSTLLGMAFKNAYFDYEAYFYGCTNNKERFEYVIRAAGGDDVKANITQINKLIKLRNIAGGEKNTGENLLENNPVINPETLAEDRIKYAKPKSVDSVYEDPDYIAIKDKIINVEHLSNELDIIQKFNDEFNEKTARIPIIDTEIADFQAKIKALKLEKKTSQKWLKDNPADFELQKKFEDDFVNAIPHNQRINSELISAYQRIVADINEFNQKQMLFQQGVITYQKVVELHKVYAQLQLSIAEYREKNTELLHKNIPMEEISLDEENELVLYNGKEMCFPNVSKGRAVRIAAEIQRAINPAGNNLIVIPEGQSLGSGLDEIIKECNEFGIQYVVEITERKQPLKIKFEEEFLAKQK